MISSYVNSLTPFSAEMCTLGLYRFPSGDTLIDFREDFGVTNKVIKFTFKCLLYLNSGNPDLREYRAPRIPLTRDKKKLRRFEKEMAEQSTIPMTLVGFDFKKPKIYTVGSAHVMGHFRWQPYGERLSKLKLIWIDPHIRHYEEHQLFGVDRNECTPSTK